MATFSRSFLVLLGLLPVLVAQKQVSSADCTFTRDPDEFLGRAARARREAVERVRQLAPPSSKQSTKSVAADAIPRRNFIDDEIFNLLTQKNVPSAPLAGDDEFLRRVHLDLTGRLPDASTVAAFQKDENKAKRDAAIEKLLSSPEFVDRWTMFLGDWLQNTSTLVNAAVNRGVGGRNAFHAYLRDAIQNDKTLSTIAKEVISANGSTNQSASGAANFPLGASTAMGPVQDTYDTMLTRTATTFLGLSSYDCLLCHNGRGRLTLTSAWGVTRTRTEAQQMAAFFSRMRFTGAAATGFEVAEAADGAYTRNTNTGNRPDRTGGDLMPEYRETGATPKDGNWRAAFAENLVQDPMFARNAANRLWKQIFNLGLVEPVDSLDPARLDPAQTPPAPWDHQATHPALLEKLSAELVKQDFKLREFLRTLVQSSAYQLSSRFGPGWNPDHVTLFNRRIARRLEAEEVHDAIALATGLPGEYAIAGWSERAAWAMQLPEPLEPTSNPAVASFLNAFLRGDRDTQERSQAGSIQQQLYLMNDAFVAERVRLDRSPRLQAIAALATRDEQLDELYLTFLSRRPTAAERTAAANATLEDLAWMCINKVEFLFSY